MGGSEQLAALAARIKAEAPQLRVELLRGLKTGAAPLVPLVKAAAAEKLPKAGGLAAIVSEQKITTAVQLSSKTASVKLKSTTARGNRQTDAGYVRHPVFAKKVASGQTTKRGKQKSRYVALGGGGYDRSLGYDDSVMANWETQEIPDAKGWWSETLTVAAPSVTPELMAVMEQISARIQAKGV